MADKFLNVGDGIVKRYADMGDGTHAEVTVALGTVNGIGVNGIVALTQAQYDAIIEPDPKTLYVITEVD